MKRELNVLLVDDNPADIRLMQEHIKIAGACCVYKSAAGVDEALNFLEGVKNDPHLFLPDLIFLDLNMPKRNGFELLDALRNDEKLMNIPTIVFSSSITPVEVIKAYDKGANCYLQKPLDSEAFGKLIENTWQFWTICVTNPSNPAVLN